MLGYFAPSGLEKRFIYLRLPKPKIGGASPSDYHFLCSILLNSKLFTLTFNYSPPKAWGDHHMLGYYTPSGLRRGFFLLALSKPKNRGRKTPDYRYTVFPLFPIYLLTVFSKYLLSNFPSSPSYCSGYSNPSGGAIQRL